MSETGPGKLRPAAPAVVPSGGRSARRGLVVWDELIPHPQTGRPLPSVGFGSVSNLARLLEQVLGRGAAGPVAVVVSRGYLARNPGLPLLDRLSSFSPTLLVHDADMTTPEGVARLCREASVLGARLLLAIGGGTVLDAAKCAAALLGVPRLDADAVVRACQEPTGQRPPGVPVVAVPTTPGTGAETTPFATVWDLAGGRKFSLQGPGVRPVAALLDPALLRTSSSRTLASGLLDSVCQGAEAVWSTRTNAEATAFGLAALGAAAPLLRGGDDRQSDAWDATRAARLLAGHLSGRAIALAPTSSCHAVSYALTLRHGLSHGHACGVTLARLLRYNLATTTETCWHPAGPAAVRDVCGAISAVLAGPAAADPLYPDRVTSVIDSHLARNGMERLDELRIEPSAVAAAALRYPRLHDNPRLLDQGVLARLLDEG